MNNINSPAVTKLANTLLKYNITLSEDNNNLNNITLTKQNHKPLKIANEIFFRKNGKCVYLKENKKTTEIEYLNDELFYNTMLAQILIHFKIYTF